MPAVSFDDVEENDVVMIADDSDLVFPNCLMVVEEVKSWGVIGTVVAPQEEEYPLRASWGEISAVYRKVELTTGG